MRANGLNCDTTVPHLSGLNPEGNPGTPSALFMRLGRMDAEPWALGPASAPAGALVVGFLCAPHRPFDAFHLNAGFALEVSGH